MRFYGQKTERRAKFIEELEQFFFVGEAYLNYTKELPKLHKDKMLHQKMDEMFTKGIEVRLLNKAEYIERLKEKVRKGQRLFLLDWQKPITIEEIETHQDKLWET